MDDVIGLNIDFEFKSHSIKNWFNDNYFICLYDKLGNFIHSFETIEEVAHFFNQSLKYVVQSIKNNRCMEYNHKRYRLYVFEKEKEEEIEMRNRK